VLGKFRDRELLVTPTAVSLILKTIDAIKDLLSYLEKHESEQAGADTELIAALNAMAEGKDVASPSPAPAAVAPEEVAPISAPAEPAIDEHGFVPVPAGDKAALEANMAVAKKAESASPAKVEAKPAEEGKGGPSVADQSVRVGVDLLEGLMNGVSELVLTRNQLLQIVRSQKDSAFTAPLQRLNQVTSELQEGVMKTRMQPIGYAWSKLPRIIRDLSHELSKKIDLQMIGAETELDRQVLELIKDPLTHMVRNSADHGIELPADRLAAGKPETGTVKLNAYHEGGHIIIEISDDGRGLALEKIKAKAIEKNLASESDLASMSDQQIMQFIFKPGFSTAAQITSVSGRGVGMDVVKTNIERIGGTIDFQSAKGKGSRFFIKIPLTLAIVSALIVECVGERFAIPQISVVELVQASANSEHRIERINDTPVLRLRNHLLPLISLRSTLKLGSNDIQADSHAFIVIAQAGSATFGLIVDRVFDTEEIVVKPVSPILRNISIYSGNTILGDGSVIMILDINGIVAQAGEIHAAETVEQGVTSTQVGKADMRQSLLLFKAGDGAPKAVPLSLVARLEEIERAHIEYSDDAPVVQYRGKLMPLVPVIEGKQIPREGTQPILVFADQEKNMGLVVDEIIDIVEETLNVNLTGHRPGFLGTSIIAGRATDVIDAAYFLSQAFHDWFGNDQEGAYGAEVGRRVLLVDDSPFFRNLLMPLLTVAGYDVTTVENAADALKMQESKDFDAIVSDIEMPGMSGFEFAAHIRQNKGRWSQLPIFAMSSHATPRDQERGRAAGFTDYVAKFDREGLLAMLHKNLQQGGEA
jgi:two-component system chemotaxis sensor kinase CheA